MLADVEHSRDVLVLDAPREPDLAPEPLERVAADGVAQDLQRDAFVELGIDRLVHAAHSAAAEPAHDAVALRDQLRKIRRRPHRRRIGAEQRVVVTADRHVLPC